MATALLTTSAAAAATNGTYRGRTAQGLPIALTVHAQKITQVHVMTKTSCGGRPVALDIGGVYKIRIHADGKFKWNFTGSGMKVSVAGVVHGRRISGVFSDSAPGKTGRICNTGSVHFHASR